MTTIEELERIIENKEALFQLLGEDELYLFEERAAIAEYEGGLTSV